MESVFAWLLCSLGCIFGALFFRIVILSKVERDLQKLEDELKLIEEEEGD